jgi:hypothetical protein
LQEQVNDKAVALIVKGGKITGRLLARAMQAFLKKAREPTFRHGRQSVKSLTKQGASLTNIEISGGNIGSFTRVARKYNIDFALKRDSGSDPPRHVVFFKAKDGDTLNAAFKEYGKVALKHKGRKPPLLERLAQSVKLAKEMAAPVRNRSKGGHEL